MQKCCSMSIQGFGEAESKKTAAERQALVFNNATVEEQFMQILESRVHAWLVKPFMTLIKVAQVF